MSTKQNSSSKLKNIFVLKEQTHNYGILFLSILLLLFSSLFLYECLKRESIIETIFGIILVIIFYSYGLFKIFTNSLLIIKLKKIKNELEPERLNYYIYQSSWTRKKVATYWTTLSYFTIFCFIFFIYLIVCSINLGFTKFMLSAYGLIIFGIVLIGTINYKIISSDLTTAKRYISLESIDSYDSIFEEKQLNILFKKIYVYLCFSLFIFPWFLMLNLKFKTKVNHLIINSSLINSKYK